MGTMADDDLTKLPDPSLLRKGGIFRTSKGQKRGPTLFQYCLAVAKVRAILKQKQYVVLAAFCRCGFYDIKECSKLFKMQQALVDQGKEELKQIQDELSNTTAWLNKHADFSGQPKSTHYQAWGNMATLPLQGKPELKEAAVAFLKKELAAVRALDKLDFVDTMPQFSSYCSVER